MVTLTVSEGPSSTDGRVYMVSNLHPASPAGHPVWVPATAIADRRARLGLSNDDDALRAIMMEHYARLVGACPDDLVVQIART